METLSRCMDVCCRRMLQCAGSGLRTVVTRDFYRQSLVNGISTTFNDAVVDSRSHTRWQIHYNKTIIEVLYDCEILFF